MILKRNDLGEIGIHINTSIFTSSEVGDGLYLSQMSHILYILSV